MTYLTPREAAAHLRLSERSLERKRLDGSGPRYTRTGRRILYSTAAIEAWAANRTFPHRAAELAQRAQPTAI